MSTFRVLQWNIQFGQGWDDARPDDAPVNIAATIAEIRRHNADILILQEVERAQPGGLQVDPPPNYTRLKEELSGYHGWFSYPKPDPRELPFGVGLAIFSRTPLASIARVDIPSPRIEFDFYGKKTTPTDRVLIGAKTSVNGREVQIFNTHLLAFFMLGTTSAENPSQRQLVAETLCNSSGPTLLAGDFNVRDHVGLVKQFATCDYSTVQTKEITWRRRPYVLDHIFYNAPLRPTAHAVIPTLASDHHILLADFEFTR
jgi:endonuclease/exonuclease/phosphatase family metal-dependent hydrolase